MAASLPLFVSCGASDEVLFTSRSGEIKRLFSAKPVKHANDAQIAIRIYRLTTVAIDLFEQPCPIVMPIGETTKSTFRPVVYGRALC